MAGEDDLQRRDDNGSRGRARTLEPAILAALAVEDAHGYSLIRSIEALTCGQVSADPGYLYRSLRFMEADGLVTSTWVPGSHGPFRRDYAITPQGLQALREWVPRLREQARCLESIASAGQAALARPHRAVEGSSAAPSRNVEAPAGTGGGR